MKQFHRNPIVWIVATTIVAAGAGIFTLSAFNPTNIAETAPDHSDADLRTRRYPIKGDLKSMRQTVEEIVPTLTTWGGKWKLAATKTDDSSENKEVIRAEVPVVFFTDDLWIELKQEANEIVVNAHSNSRVGKSDLGETRRHLLQILPMLDEKFK